MSDEILSPVVTLIVLAVLALWVPGLNFCYGRCKRLATGRANRNAGSIARASNLSDPA